MTFLGINRDDKGLQKAQAADEAVVGWEWVNLRTDAAPGLTVETSFYFLDIVIPLQIFENGFMEQESSMWRECKIKNEMGRRNINGFTQTGKRKDNNLPNKMELLRWH